jgi:hypothetical protein
VTALVGSDLLELYLELSVTQFLSYELEEEELDGRFRPGSMRRVLKCYGALCLSVTLADADADSGVVPLTEFPNHTFRIDGNLEIAIWVEATSPVGFIVLQPTALCAIGSLIFAVPQPGVPRPPGRCPDDCRPGASL